MQWLSGLQRRPTGLTCRISRRSRPAADGGCLQRVDRSLRSHRSPSIKKARAAAGVAVVAEIHVGLVGELTEAGERFGGGRRGWWLPVTLDSPIKMVKCPLVTTSPHVRKIKSLESRVFGELYSILGAKKMPNFRGFVLLPIIFKNPIRIAELRLLPYECGRTETQRS